MELHKYFEICYCCLSFLASCFLGSVAPLVRKYELLKYIALIIVFSGLMVGKESVFGGKTVF